MLGVSIAGSAVSIAGPRCDAERLPRIGFWLSVAMAVLFLATITSATWAKAAINAAIDTPAAALIDTPTWMRHELATQRFTPWIGVVMLLPYLTFGLLVTWTMIAAGSAYFHKVYAVDLVGGALGALVAYAAFELLPFPVVALIPPAFALAGAMAYVAHFASGRRLVGTGAVLVAAFAGTVFALGDLEPDAHPALVTRQEADTAAPTEELWSAWTSYSRVGAFAIDGQPKVMVLGNGEGHASLAAYPPDPATGHRIIPELATVLGEPKEVLVLFAGAGSDLLKLDARLQGRTNLTGVELNPRVVEAAERLPNLHLSEFYKLPHVRMVVDEARSFLEKDSRRYDVIVLSWTGATASYHTGSIGQTSQFVYTREAFERMFSKLNPGGYVVVVNANKIRVLATAREALAAHGVADPSRSVAVLKERNVEPEVLQLWDQFRVLIRPDGFNEPDVAAIAASPLIGEEGVLYAPGRERDERNSYYYDVLHTPDLGQYLAFLTRTTGLGFQVATDDRPFILNETRAGLYLEPSYWWSAIESTAPMLRAPVYRLRWLTYIVIGALALVLLPMVLARRTFVRIGRAQARYLGYFLALGAGFMLVEIGVMHKTALVLGNPGLAIAVVLAGAVAFTGFGSLASARLLKGRMPMLRASTAALVAYVALLVTVGDRIAAVALGWTGPLRIVGVLAALLPLFFLAGLFFPFGLSRCEQDEPRLVPWAWAVNGAFGAIAGTLAPILASGLGFDSVIALGAALYLGTLLLPRVTVSREP